jgi:hypothetical protein
MTFGTHLQKLSHSEMLKIKPTDPLLSVISWEDINPNTTDTSGPKSTAATVMENSKSREF